MHFVRRFGSRASVIIALIGLSILLVVLFGESFKVLLVRRDGVQLSKRDGTSTITLNMPWKPVLAAAKPEFKDVSQDMGSLIGDIGAVASAILGAGSELASAASSGVAGLEPSQLTAGSTALQGGSASASSVLREVNGQIQQATSIMEGILGDATSIVGSILAAATSPSNIGVIPHVNSNSSMNGMASASSSVSSTTGAPQEFLPQPALCRTCSNSGPTIPINVTGLVTPHPSASIAPVTNALGLIATPSSCPSTLTETCTVTETWHSTHYAETVTFFTFIANTTITCTETVRVCPTPLLYVPTTSISNLPLQSLITCANGGFAKRQEECPYIFNATSSQSLSTSKSASANSPISSHPCPNAGYSCDDCPDGWFCPPPQTPAGSCGGGYGWACANCNNGCFFIPSPTSGGNTLLNPVVSLFAIPTVLHVDTITPMPTSVSTLHSLGTMVPISSGTVTCVGGAVVLSAQECLNLELSATANTVDIAIINMPMAADVAALTSSNGVEGGLLSTVKADASSLLGSSQLVGIAGLTTAAGDILTTATVALGNAAANVANQLPTSTLALISSAIGNIPSQQSPALGAGLAKRKRA